MPGNRTCSLLQDLVRHLEHGELQLTLGLPEPVPLELLGQYGRVVGREFAEPVLPPQRCRYFDPREAGYDEIRQPANLVGSRLVRIELDEGGTVAEDAQPRPSETRRDSGVPAPAALRALSTRRASGGVPRGRSRGFISRPALSSRARVRSASDSSRSGSTAAVKRSTTQPFTLRPSAAAWARTSFARPSSRRTVN